MKTLAYNEVINNIFKVLEMVQSGEEIVIKNTKNQKSVAVILPYDKYKTNKERPLGILKGRASYKIKDDFKITDEGLLRL